MTPPILRTDRLVLRPMLAEDVVELTEMFADPAVSRYLDVDLTVAAAVQTMVDRITGTDYPPGLGHWVAELDGEVVGRAHLRPSWELPGDLPEVGWYLARPHWNKGLAGELAGALLRHAAALGLPSVWALVHEDNAASLTLARRLGFLEVGERESYGGPHRVHVFHPPPAERGPLHHVELWLPDVEAAETSLGWLLGELGWTEYQRWEHGVSWRLGATYLVVEASPAMSAPDYDRLRPGLNHLALHAGTRREVDYLTRCAIERGWDLMFPDRHPHAGGDKHYAAYLSDASGVEVELVAGPS